jgi:hypothetical protein
MAQELIRDFVAELARTIPLVMKERARARISAGRSQ